MSTSEAAAPHFTGMRLIGAAILCGFANFMVVLDTTIANVSVPHIAGGLAVSPSQGTWVITSYSVAEAITVPLTGWLVQRFGTVKVFASALIGFALFSTLCGLAPSFALLVAFRVLQGLAGGPLMPTSQTLMLLIFPRERSAQALGMWSLTTVTAPVFGPLLGGLISDSIGWPWIFFINVPFGLAAAVGAWMVLRRYETAIRRVPVDYVGLGLLILWVGSLQIMLDRGKELEWFASSFIISLAILAAIGLAAFVIWELTAENPVVDLRVFRHRGFTVGASALSLTFGAFFSSVVLVPLWLQTSLGYTATWAGYATAFNAVLAAVMSPIIARLVGRYDVRAIIFAGLCWLTFVSFWRSHFETGANFWAIALPFLAQGFATPFFMVGCISMALGSVLPQETASAAGIVNFMRTTAGAFATSIVTTAWENTATEKRSQIVGHLHDLPATLGTLQAHGLTAAQATGQVDRLVQTQAVMLATNQMFTMMMLVFAGTAAVVWLAPRPRRRAAGGGGH